jgi:DNA polymerase-3 subunit delta'
MTAPRLAHLLIGHPRAEAAILDAMRGTRLHHAWLITGPEGVGKATLAFRFARRLLAGGTTSLDMPPDHPVFRRIAAGTHADLLTVEREWDEKKKRMKKTIAADTARAIPPFLHLTAAEGGFRVVIVDGAEDLNPQSANALLKVLEEPPPRAVLMLVCNAPAVTSPWPPWPRPTWPCSSSKPTPSSHRKTAANSPPSLTAPRAAPKPSPKKVA